MPDATIGEGQAYRSQALRDCGGIVAEFRFPVVIHGRACHHSGHLGLHCPIAACRGAAVLKSPLLYAFTVALATAAASPALANAWRSGPPGGPRPTPSTVPEIDASTGLIAVAVVAALLALAWERRRRMAG
jgi:hypothetical protein